MSNAAADDVVEEVWTPKAAAAAKQEARQPKSGKFAALASGIPILGAKSDDNLQPCPPPSTISLLFLLTVMLIAGT
jgi:hypothetical protein